jgi:hypothetical protein
MQELCKIAKTILSEAVKKDKGNTRNAFYDNYITSEDKHTDKQKQGRDTTRQMNVKRSKERRRKNDRRKRTM